MDDYTPIVIFYAPPVIVDGQSNNDTIPISLEICPPDSASVTVTQILPVCQRYILPHHGWLRLKLRPTEDYLPMGFYRVRFFQFKNRLPFLEQQWYVPRYNVVEEISVTRRQGEADELPDNIYSILSLSIPGSWRLEANRLLWLENAPTLGTVYRIRVVRGLTLNQLVRRRPSSLSVR